MMRITYQSVKRIIDLVAAMACIVVLLPLLMVVSALVLVTMGRPVLFRQKRCSLCEKVFSIYKFRTMREAHDGEGNPLPDEQRVTSIGRMLRRLKLDELPELFNVLEGDMSFVGPRPLLAEYCSRYSAWECRRHEVRPGLTGWAQANGNTMLSWPEKMAMDVWYVDHISFLLDLGIVLKTLGVVVFGERVNGKAVSDATHSTNRSC